MTNISGCVALEMVRLISGHDCIAEDPTANDGSCLYGFWNWNTESWAASNSRPPAAPNHSHCRLFDFCTPMCILGFLGQVAAGRIDPASPAASAHLRDLARSGALTPFTTRSPTDTCAR